MDIIDNSSYPYIENVWLVDGLKYNLLSKLIIWQWYEVVVDKNNCTVIKVFCFMSFLCFVEHFMLCTLFYDLFWCVPFDLIWFYMNIFMVFYFTGYCHTRFVPHFFHHVIPYGLYFRIYKIFKCSSIKV